MKKILFSLGILMCVMFCNTIPVFAQWSVTGKQGFSDGGTSFNNLAIDKTNTPYIAYVDLANNDKITVKKHNGTDWVVVGKQGFSIDKAKDVCIATSNNTPFVAYSDLSYGHKIVVQHFDGESWAHVGMPGFSAGRANYISFAIDAHNVPYVAFNDEGNSKKLVVMKYDGTSWVKVGNIGLSWGEAIAINMAIDNAGMPYIIFKDLGIDGQTRVIKYTGSSWTDVGVAGLGYGIHANQSSITIDAKGTPYVTYATVDARESRLLKYENASWVTAGETGFAIGAVQQPSLKASPNGDIYITYTDGGLGNTIRLLQYTDGSISAIEVPAKGDYPSLAIDNDDQPYISFRDFGNGQGAKATLLKYERKQDTRVTAINNPATLCVYPNPATNVLTTQNRTVISRVMIYDMTGKIVTDLQSGSTSVTVDVSKLPKGMYLLNAVSEDGKIQSSHFQKL